MRRANSKTVAGAARKTNSQETLPYVRSGRLECV
jgi:hypothetical protein